MAAPEIQKSNRDRFGERLKAKYPDREYADDEALFGQIGADYDEYEGKLADSEKRIGEYQASEQKLGDMFTKDPRSAAFLQSWRDGQDPVVALVEMFGDEIIDAINDPSKMEEIAEARAKFVERVAEEAKNTETYKTNLAESLQTLEQYQSERGMSDEQIDQLMEEIIRVTGDVVMGKFEAETLEMFQRARNYTADVEEAGAQGEVRGRNAQIEERLRRPKQGDGTAQLAQGAAGAQSGQRKRPSIFEEARLAQ